MITTAIWLAIFVWCVHGDERRKRMTVKTPWLLEFGLGIGMVVAGFLATFAVNR